MIEADSVDPADGILFELGDEFHVVRAPNLHAVVVQSDGDLCSVIVNRPNTGWQIFDGAGWQPQVDQMRRLLSTEQVIAWAPSGHDGDCIIRPVCPSSTLPAGALD